MGKFVKTFISHARFEIRDPHHRSPNLILRPNPNAAPFMRQTLEWLWGDSWFGRRTCVELNSESSW